MSIVTRDGADAGRWTAWRARRPAVGRAALYGFAALTLAPFVPGLVAALAFALGSALGCDVEAIGGCRVAGVGLGPVIAATARLGWFVPVLAIPGAIAATFVMQRAVASTALRLALGAALPMLCALFAGAIPVALVVEASRASCVINEASTGGCHVYGAPVYDVVQAAAAVPRWLAGAFAVTAAYVAGYGLLLIERRRRGSAVADLHRPDRAVEAERSEIAEDERPGLDREAVAEPQRDARHERREGQKRQA
jgi:hypothetical protein